MIDFKRDTLGSIEVPLDRRDGLGKQPEFVTHSRETEPDMEANRAEEPEREAVENADAQVSMQAAEVAVAKPSDVNLAKVEQGADTTALNRLNHLLQTGDFGALAEEDPAKLADYAEAVRKNQV